MMDLDHLVGQEKGHSGLLDIGQGFTPTHA